MKISFVSTNIYRGSRPETTDDLDYLKGLGVKTIISLETGFGEFWDDIFGRDLDEKPSWDIRGGIYFDFPFSNFLPPTRAQTDEVIQQIKTSLQSGKVFVHCYAGCDRTGWVCAAWRVLVEGKDPESAWGEALIMGLHARYRWWKSAFMERIGK